MTVTPIRRGIPLALALTDPSTAAESWRRYVRRVAAGMSSEALSARTLIAPSSIADWEVAPPMADDVLAFATWFNTSPWEALNSAGLIPAFMDDVKTYLAAFSEAELSEELAARQRGHEALTTTLASS